MKTKTITAIEIKLAFTIFLLAVTSTPAMAGDPSQWSVTISLEDGVQAELDLKRPIEIYGQEFKKISGRIYCIGTETFNCENHIQMVRYIPKKISVVEMSGRKYYFKNLPWQYQELINRHYNGGKQQIKKVVVWWETHEGHRLCLESDLLDAASQKELSEIYKRIEANRAANLPARRQLAEIRGLRNAVRDAEWSADRARQAAENTSRELRMLQLDIE